jgi:hypothetical protein
MSLFQPLAAACQSEESAVPAHSAQPAGVQLFQTEAAARVSFPGEIIVWVNTETAAVHRRGSRWYGNTRYGGYTNERDAEF